MRKPLPVVLAASLLVSSILQVQAQRTARQLWPLKQGNQWNLRLSVGGRTLDIATKVTSVRGSVATLDFLSHGKSTQLEKYSVTPTQINRLAAGVGGLDTISPGLPIIKFGLRSGSKWKWKGVIRSRGRLLKAKAALSVSRAERVTVQAGTFMARKVHLALTIINASGPTTYLNDYWFASRVGLVKQSADVSGTKMKGELISYNLVK